MLSHAIVGHLVGDYLLQNDWQAQGKKQSSWICSVHCVLWSASVMLFPLHLWLLLAFSVVVFAVSLAALLWANRALRDLDRIFGSEDGEEPPCDSAS